MSKNLAGGRAGKYDDPGWFPEKIDTPPITWELADGHINEFCAVIDGLTLGSPACPACLALELAEDAPDGAFDESIRG